MKCISPISILLTNSANERITIPCGKCLNCMQEKRDSWVFRIKEEYKICKGAKFITLTYADETCPLTKEGYHTLRKRDIQLLLKRIRKTIDSRDTRYQPKQNNGLEELKMPPLRYFCVGEYGEKTLRPHYHMIIFNLYNDIDITKSWCKFNKKQNIFEPIGYVHIGTVTGASINYLAKYVIKNSTHLSLLYKLGVEPQFSIMSKGIGQAYLERAGMYHKKSKITYVSTDGRKLKLPKYYEDKIFNHKEKETIKLTKQKYSDEAEKIKHQKLRQLGNNPFAYERDNHIRKIRTVKKIKNLKSKL